MDSGVPEGGPRPGILRGCALSTMLALAASMPFSVSRAQDRTAPSGPAAARAGLVKPATPDPAFESLKAAFEALPEAERRAVQDALVWTGDFNAVISGAFGRRTFEALQAFGARTGGVALDGRGRAAILATGDAARTAARFRVAADAGSGAVIGVPERLLSRRTALPAGTRWQSADGRVTLETRAYPPGGDGLDAPFERATAPSPERRVTYKLRRPDFFVVTAETALGLSYIRYSASIQGVRGFLVGYDRAMAPEVDRLVIAVANSFDPFPGAAPAASPMPAPAPAAPVAPPRIAGTGLVVAAGRVLTASTVLAGCSPRLGSEVLRVLATDPAGLALLGAAGTPAPIQPAFGADGNAGLIALAAGPDGVSAAPAEGVADGVVAPLQPGAAGAPVLDRAGRIAGIVARYPAAPRLVAGVAPPARLPLVAGEAAAAFLARQGIAAPETPHGASPGALSPAIVAIGCG